MDLFYNIMSAGRVIRFLILILIGVLVWKVWDYALPRESEKLQVQTGSKLFQSSKDVNPSRPAVIMAAPTQKEDMVVPVKPQVRVEVYYEALCPDSKYFIMKQLSLTYDKLHDFISLALIPYGKATTYENGPKITFDCQHGPRECQANKVHACVVKHVKDEGTQLKIIHCMIEQNSNPMKIGKKCVEKYAKNWSEVEKCATSDVGNMVLKHMGDMTHSLKPAVKFIPTITVDGSQDDQKIILHGLLEVLCKRYKGQMTGVC